VIAENFGVGEVAYVMLWFFLFVVEIWLMIWIFTDIFRSHDLSGWAKALWVVAIFLFPLFGILVYLVVRGGGMHERALRAAREGETQFRRYVQSIGQSPADELTRLAELRDRGVISEEEFQRLKESIVGKASSGAP
jgi:hypothetical protein